MATAEVEGGAGALAIVVPMVDEAATLPALLVHLAGWRARGCEVVLVDGGSRDDSVEMARAAGFRVLIAERGRARQMNAGAQACGRALLLFLHADTRLPEAADAMVCAALAVQAWGRFDVCIDGRSPLLPVVARMMNWRSRLTGIATGDQAIFVRRDAFRGVGGYPELPLMEDIALSKRLQRYGRPACLGERVITSGRRWEKHGVWRTILLMWRLRASYFLGADPQRLALRYGYRPPRR